MSNHDDHRTDPGNDRDLSRLISDAVSDVEPTDRLEELRARTAPSPRRPWLLATGGAVVAAAAVVTAIALVSGDQVTSPEPGPAAPPSSQVPSSGASGSDDPTDEAVQSTVGVYYLGDTPAGLRLYREFRQGQGEPLEAAVALLTSTPADPDYRTAWEPGGLLGAVQDGGGEDGLISVEVDPGVRERPQGMSEEEARLAVEQVVHTVQGAAGARAPVQFRTVDNPIDQVLGVPTSEPITNGPALQTLALVNLTTPAEGQTVSGDVLEVEGVANSFEANVLWSVESQEGTSGPEGFFTADGWMEDKLFPFSGEIDVSSLDPGTYTLTVETDDPTGGQEGFGPFSDTRTFVIE